MRKLTCMLLLVVVPMVAALAETYRWSDGRGDQALVTHPGVPKSPALAKAFKARFFPTPERLHDPDFLVEWETTVELGRLTPRYYSAVSRGLTLYKDSKGQVVGAHPAKIMDTLTWDLRKNQEVTLERLIDKAQYTKLARLIGDHAEAREAFNPQAHYEFYLRKNGVAFFDPDAPHVAFGIESVVPYAELLPLAAPHSPLLDSAVSGH
ncbi:MAG: hypothetical protein U0931_28025 [Vulcanimicrobiota bacterium]